MKIHISILCLLLTGFGVWMGWLSHNVVELKSEVASLRVELHSRHIANSTPAKLTP